jgi:hypothetical protein
MKQFNIVKNGQVTHSAKFASLEAGNAWVSEHETMQSFGKPACVRIHRVVIQEAVFEDRQKMIQAAIFDENDQEIEPAVYETVSECVMPEVVDIQEVQVPAEYSIVVEDISAQLEQEAINAESKAFLASTDWLVVRMIETGVPMPEEIRVARQAAREAVVE